MALRQSQPVNGSNCHLSVESAKAEGALRTTFPLNLRAKAVPGKNQGKLMGPKFK